MKRTYSNPMIDVMTFSQEEILTDIISVSTGAVQTPYSGTSWGDFVGGNNA